MTDGFNRWVFKLSAIVTFNIILKILETVGNSLHVAFRKQVIGSFMSSSNDLISHITAEMKVWQVSEEAAAVTLIIRKQFHSHFIVKTKGV